MEKKERAEHEAKMKKYNASKSKSELQWWFDWLEWDLEIMWPAWYVFQQFFSGGEATVFESFVQTYDNVDTAWWYLWAFIWYPFELVFDAVIFVVLSPVYLVDFFIMLFDGEDGKGDGKKGRKGGKK